eukprot:TRINITY_DN488_c0_g1_i1.p1 TRINITY_DN488_c0_g1~~TRINITY_DN488_c0_g1_i1.p1  ORF type:complete len:953 (+),score=412.35 TRINITY_DN488_c0_g1_i1:118-2976(+)
MKIGMRAACAALILPALGNAAEADAVTADGVMRAMDKLAELEAKTAKSIQSWCEESLKSQTMKLTDLRGKYAQAVEAAGGTGDADSDSDPSIISLAAVEGSTSEEQLKETVQKMNAKKLDKDRVKSLETQVKQETLYLGEVNEMCLMQKKLANKIKDKDLPALKETLASMAKKAQEGRIMEERVRTQVAQELLHAQQQAPTTAPVAPAASAPEPIFAKKVAPAKAKKVAAKDDNVEEVMEDVIKQDSDDVLKEDEAKLNSFKHMTEIPQKPKDLKNVKKGGKQDSFWGEKQDASATSFDNLAAHPAEKKKAAPVKKVKAVKKAAPVKKVKAVKKAAAKVETKTAEPTKKIAATTTAKPPVLAAAKAKDNDDDDDKDADPTEAKSAEQAADRAVETVDQETSGEAESYAAFQARMHKLIDDDLDEDKSAAAKKAATDFPSEKKVALDDNLADAKADKELVVSEGTQSEEERMRALLNSGNDAEAEKPPAAEAKKPAEVEAKKPADVEAKKPAAVEAKKPAAAAKPAAKVSAAKQATVKAAKKIVKKAAPLAPAPAKAAAKKEAPAQVAEKETPAPAAKKKTSLLEIGDSISSDSDDGALSLRDTDSAIDEDAPNFKFDDADVSVAKATNDPLDIDLSLKLPKRGNLRKTSLLEVSSTTETKPVEAKSFKAKDVLSSDLNMMMNLYNEDGSLPDRYNAWKPTSASSLKEGTKAESFFLQLSSQPETAESLLEVSDQPKPASTEKASPVSKAQHLCDFFMSHVDDIPQLVKAEAASKKAKKDLVLAKAEKDSFEQKMYLETGRKKTLEADIETINGLIKQVKQGGIDTAMTELDDQVLSLGEHTTPKDMMEATSQADRIKFEHMEFADMLEGLVDIRTNSLKEYQMALQRAEEMNLQVSKKTDDALNQEEHLRKVEKKVEGIRAKCMKGKNPDAPDEKKKQDIWKETKPHKPTIF